MVSGRLSCFVLFQVSFAFPFLILRVGPLLP